MHKNSSVWKKILLLSPYNVLVFFFGLLSLSIFFFYFYSSRLSPMQPHMTLVSFMLYKFVPMQRSVFCFCLLSISCFFFCLYLFKIVRCATPYGFLSLAFTLEKIVPWAIVLFFFLFLFIYFIIIIFGYFYPFIFSYLFWFLLLLLFK